MFSNICKHSWFVCRNNKNIDPTIVENLSKMLYENNTHAKCFRMARERLNSDIYVPDLKLRLISDRKTDGRIYNLPTVSEVAALIAGDIGDAEEKDIIIQAQGGQLQRIDEFHASYLAYEYPLLFPYGEDGYRPDIAHRETEEGDDVVNINKHNRLTIREWLAYRIHMRLFEAKTLLSSRRLFQEYLVDGFTMLEAENLVGLEEIKKSLEFRNTRILIMKVSRIMFRDQLKEKYLFYPLSMLEVTDLWINFTLTGWLYAAKLGFPMFSLPLHVILNGQKL